MRVNLSVVVLAGILLVSEDAASDSISPKCSVTCDQIIAGTGPASAADESGAEIARRYNGLLAGWRQHEKEQSSTEMLQHIAASTTTGIIGKIPVIGDAISATLREANNGFEKQSHEAERQTFGRLLVTLETSGELGRLQRQIKNDPTADPLRLIDAQLRRAHVLQEDESLFDDLSADARSETQRSISRLTLSGVQKLANLQGVNRAEIASVKKNIQTLQKTISDLRADRDKANQDYAEVQMDSATDEDVYRAKVAVYVKSSAEYGRQFEALGEILHDVHASPDMQKAVAIAAGAAKVSGQVAQCTVDAVSCLPALASTFHFLSVFGGGSQQSELEAAVERIMARLDAIERKIDEYHRQEMQQLDSIKGNQLLIYDLVRDLSLKDAAQCRTLVNSDAYEKTEGLKAGLLKRGHQTQFASYEQFSRVANEHIHQIDGCLRGLQAIFYPPIGSERISPLLIIPPIDAEIDNSSVFSQDEKDALRSHKIFLAHRKFIKDFLRPSVVALSERASPTFGDIDQKTTATGESADSATAFFKGNFDQELYSPIVLRITGILVGVHFYWEMWKPPGELISKRELMAQQQPTGRGTAKDVLESAQDVLDVAVAQQAVLGGDLILPLAYEAWETLKVNTDVSSPDQELMCGKWRGSDILARESFQCGSATDAREKAKSLRNSLFDPQNGLVAHNSLFAYNLVRYIVYRRSIENGCTSRLYDGAWKSSHQSQLLHRCLGGDLLLTHWSHASTEEKKSDGWSMFIGGEAVPLPTPPEMASQSVLLLPVTVGLVDVRKRIEEARIGYAMTEDGAELQRYGWDFTKKLLQAGAWPITEQYRRAKQ